MSAEEAAERDKIRREIQEKMQAMRKKMSEEKAAASPPPVAIKSPVSNRSASRGLLPIAPASSGSADGDVFWKNLLSDLRLLDNGKFCKPKHDSLFDILAESKASHQTTRLPQISTTWTWTCAWMIWMCPTADGARRLVAHRMVPTRIAKVGIRMVHTRLL